MAEFKLRIGKSDFKAEAFGITVWGLSGGIIVCPQKDWWFVEIKLVIACFRIAMSLNATSYEDSKGEF
jgi:hypothetical protein